MIYSTKKKKKKRSWNTEVSYFKL